MKAHEEITERWFAAMAAASPGLSTDFLGGGKDRFRNPVGHNVRTGLAILVEELFGDMDPARVAPALDTIVRIRAVQDLTATQAAGFAFLLKPVLRSRVEAEELRRLEDRVDQLALMAFEQYVRCRGQVAEIRANEQRRTVEFAARLERRAR